MKKWSSIESIQAIHREGHLDHALQGYLTLLEEEPDNIAALHYLGILYAEMGKLEAAQACLEKAIKLDAHDPALSLHLANILKARELFSEATHVLQTMLEEHPRFAAGHNNLGSILYAQGRWEDAVNAYKQAIAIQANYTDAYYNLALAFAKLKNFPQSLAAYNAVLEFNPDHAGARFQLASLFMQKNQYAIALEHLHLIAQKHPFHFETQSNMAACFLKLGNLAKAEKHYLLALDILPNDKQVLFNLGVLHMQQARTQKAIEFYLKAVEADPDFFEAQNNLGAAFLALKNKSLALLHFREAERIAPQDEALRHTVKILSQESHLSSSPLAYVQSLFDAYADHYDAHLVQTLHYQIPALLYETVMKAGLLNENKGDILDLGCGTGLCGQLFKSRARSLTGIDISANMLHQARLKDIYDELIEGDILTFLKTKENAYDLIIAGDVLVYFGELRPLFCLMAVALKNKGLLVFNVECDESRDYVMTTSGRFAHSRSYLAQLTSEIGFELLQCRPSVFRTQEHLPVSGDIYLLKKHA